MPYLRRLSASIVVAASLASLAYGTTAHAQGAQPQWGPYFSVGAGVSVPEPQHFNVPNAIVNTAQKFGFDDGFEAAGAFGYKWYSGLRSELEFEYRKTDVGRIDGIPASGSRRDWGGMANLLYDLPISIIVQPYVGGGVGVATDRLHTVSGGALAGFQEPVFTSDDAARFQWQAIGGVNLALSPHFALFADYRYIQVTNTHINTAPLGTFRSGSNVGSSNILVGMRFFMH